MKSSGPHRHFRRFYPDKLPASRMLIIKDPEPALNNFLPRAEILGRKLGPILSQLPLGGS